MQETWVQFLGQEKPLEKEMVTHSSILAWRIPWAEEPGRVTCVHGVTKVRHNLPTKTPPGTEQLNSLSILKFFKKDVFSY